MAKHVSQPRYRVTLNGVTLFGGLSLAEAHAKAEKWQGSHAEHRGLLKHKDLGDWVEVKRDYAYEREYDERYDEAQRNNPQRFIMEMEA